METDGPAVAHFADPYAGEGPSAAQYCARGWVNAGQTKNRAETFCEILEVEHLPSLSLNRGTWHCRNQGDRPQRANRFWCNPIAISKKSVADRARFSAPVRLSH